MDMEIFQIQKMIYLNWFGLWRLRSLAPYFFVYDKLSIYTYTLFLRSELNFWTKSFSSNSRELLNKVFLPTSELYSLL
jgi:hypothetical protein